MKFKLLVNPDIDEAVQASVHKRSDFTEKLEQLVMAYNGADSITAYGTSCMKPPSCCPLPLSKSTSQP